MKLPLLLTLPILVFGFELNFTKEFSKELLSIETIEKSIQNTINLIHLNYQTLMLNLMMVSIERILLYIYRQLSVMLQRMQTN